METIPSIKIKTLDENFNEIERDIEFKLVDDNLYCSDIYAIDYYGEFRGNYSWVCEEIINWCNSKGYFYDWENPEQIIIVEE